MPLSTVLARVCLMGFLLPAVAPATPPETPKPSGVEAERAERLRTNGDALLGDALQGMALVVIPTVNLDAQAGRDFDDPAVRDKFARQGSVLMRWQDKTEADFGISAGPGEHRFNKTDIGPIFQTTRGAVTYQVIPVWPGEYQLTRITYQQRRTDLPKLDADLEVLDMKREMAYASLRERVDFDFKKIDSAPKQEEDTSDGLGQGCMMMMRLGDGCDEAAKALRWELNGQRAVAAGAAERQEVPGMDVELSFAPVASITLSKGDVVLTDGFVLQDGQPVMRTDMCGYWAGERLCGLQSLIVQRLPASLQDLRQARSAASFNMPRLEAALQRLEYRAPTMLVEPADKATPNVIRAERR